jgi:hypothetical protein
MNLYHDNFRGRLRWYVKVSKTGRRIDVVEEYSTAEQSDFHKAWEAAVRALGGVPRMRRTKPDEAPATSRRYLISDVSDKGQLRWYVQLRDKLPKIRINEEFGSDEFNRAVDAAIVDQIGKFGDATDWVRAEKQTREEREPLPTTPPVPGSFRWYWMLYKQSDRWLGNLAIGEEGLAESTRDARTGLIESLLGDNGERSFAALTRRVLREELKARTPVQAGNLLSALRHMIGWMIDEEHIEPDDDPTIGLKSGKAKASRESGGWVPWTEEDMAKYRARWPLGTEARLMFDILHYTHLRLGDASRFGSAPPAAELEDNDGQGRDRKEQGPHHGDGARASRLRGLPGGGAQCRHLGNGRGLHGQAGEGRDRADEQEGVGGKVQEVCPAGRRQRAQRELPWRAQGARRSRGLLGVHGSADDGDVRLARSQNAGALHRQSEPGQACDQWDGEDRDLRSNGEHRRSGDADRPEQNSNFRE